MISSIGIMFVLICSNFMIHNQSKVSPKTIYINLPKAAKQQSAKSSPERTPDKFKLPLSKLKKTLGSNQSVFEKINENKKSKLNQIRHERQAKKALQQEIQLDLEGEKPLSENDLLLCKELFKKVDRERKGFIQAQDLKYIASEGLKEVLEVVFYRKQRNQLFDFIYNCWDTGILEKVKRLENKWRAEDNE